MAAPRRGLTSAAVLVGGWVLGASLGWGGPTAATWVSDLSLPLLAVLAAWALALGARRRPRGQRLPLALLSLSCALWATGESVWSWYELVLKDDGPVPSAADVAYLAAAPVAAAGVLALSHGVRRRGQRTRTVLDGFLVAGACFAVGWVALLAPVAQDSAGGPLAVVVAVTYPVMDIALVTVVLIALRAAGPARRTELRVVAMAALAMAAADAAYTLLELRGSYQSGSVVDAGWVLAYLLFAIAGRTEPSAEATEVDADAPTGRLAVLLPYGFVLVAVAVLGSAHLTGHGTGAVGVVLLAVLVAALLVRQAVTALDNAALASLLALRERHFRSLVHGTQDVIVLCDKAMVTTYASPSAEAVLGFRPADLVGRPFWELVHPDDVGQVHEAFDAALDGTTEGVMIRCRVATGDGGWVDTESTVGDLRGDPSVAGIVVTTRDISERTALETQLRVLAWEDPLTGLANRTLLRERLEHALSQRRSASEPLGLLLIDLDGFKPVNDTYGHATGDALLVMVAQRLLEGVRKGDTVARLGGDEFAVLLEGPGENGLRRGGLDVADRLLDLLSREFVVDGKELSISASIGLAIAGAADDADALMRQADFALYASKDAGRGRVTVFGASLAAQSTRRGEIAKGLADALAEERLNLAYQPVVDLATGRVIGAEALARWEHPVWGSVPPSEFVPVAERTGLIVPLGHWALVTAAAQARRWEQQGLELGMAVNVSVRQLGPELVAEVERVLERMELSPGRLTLEITESVLADDERTLRSLQDLGSLGVRLSLDDFGTGWSSLAYLRRLPLDVLKLDSSFVAGLGATQADAVSRTVIRLGTDLGLEVLAEGVETVAQRDILREMGCHSAQGWLYGAAGPAEAVTRVREAAHVVPPQPRRARADEALRSIM
jgi:diguanylate cyclase (GGDEF)-like protein/PAS domain S-box-containing protein